MVEGAGEIKPGASGEEADTKKGAPERTPFDVT